MEDFTRIAVLPECIYLFNCNEELTSNTLDLLKKEEFTDTSLVNHKTVNVNLNKDLKYEKLYKWFDECILKVHNSYLFDCEKVSITQSWGCKYIYGSHQHFHNHPNSLMSGVFFLTDSGSILPVAGSISAQTIFAPIVCIGSFVAIQVIGVDITSFPGPTPDKS